MKTWSPLLWWAGLMALIGVLPLMIGWSSLPDPIAIHWGFGGMPDNAWPKAAAIFLPVGMVALGLFTTSLFRLEGRPTAEAVGMVGLMGGIGFSLTSSLVYLNWDVPTWHDAGAFGWWHLVGILIGGGLGVWAGYVLGLRWYPRPLTPMTVEGPEIAVADGETVSWIGGCTVVWPLLLLSGVSVLFLVMDGWWKLMGLVFLLLGLLFSRVYVVINNDGLQVRLGGGVPAKRIPLDRVKTVEAIDLEPAQWAGWGYRVVPGGSAVVLRRGDAIQVNMTNDRKFAVTVDDAATGTALLRGLVGRFQGNGS